MVGLIFSASNGISGSRSAWTIGSDRVLNFTPDTPLERPNIFNGVHYFSGIGNYQPSGSAPASSLRSQEPLGALQNLQLSWQGTPLYNGDPVVEFGGRLFFTATREALGTELWALDSQGSVSLVADVFGGVESSFPRSFQVFDDHLYFIGWSERTIHGQLVPAFYELALDGSLRQLAQLPPGFTDPQYATIDNQLVISGIDPAGAGALWTVTDSGLFARAWGTEFDTQIQVIDSLYSRGSTVYFSARGAGNGIWMLDSDGVPSRIMAVESPFYQPASPFVELKGNLYVMVHQLKLDGSGSLVSERQIVKIASSLN